MLIKAVLCAVVVAAVLPSDAHAETATEAQLRIAKEKPADFPNRAIEVTVTNPPGGGTDVSARFFAKYFEKYIGQSVVVNNRAGGSGLVGYTWLATEAPSDGTVVGFVGNSIINTSLMRANGKWTYKDLDPIALANFEPIIWMVNAKGPFKDKTLLEIARIAKEMPETVKVAVAPNASFQMLAEQVEALTGAKFIKVPFSGDSPARQALLGQHVDIAFGFAGQIRGSLDAGDLQIIGVSGDDRLPDYNKALTFNEQLGSTAVQWVTWRYVVVPKGMTASTKAFLVAAAQAAVSDPELINEYAKLGAQTDPKINKPELVSAALDKIAQSEITFYRASGRLK